MFPSEYYMYRSFRDNKMSKPGIMSMPLFGIRGEVRAQLNIRCLAREKFELEMEFIALPFDALQ